MLRQSGDKRQSYSNRLNWLELGPQILHKGPERWLAPFRGKCQPAECRGGGVLFFSRYAIFIAPFSASGRLRTRETKMANETHSDLSRRERQIVDILYAQGRATAAEVQAALPDPPSYSAVRAMLRILEEKGHVAHEQDGPRYVYRPTVARDNAKRSALRHMLRTFFDGSAEQAISALLDDSSTRLSDRELDRLARMIDQARRTGA
jgi:BlaI family penicillinase repressor